MASRPLVPVMRRPCGVRPGGLLHRVVLEHDEGVEEFGQAGGALDVGQAEVVVVEEADESALDVAEQCAQRAVGAQPYPNRHGVHEESDHRLDAGQGGGAAGDGGAEQHVVAAGRPAEQDRPGGLHQGVGGYAELAGKGGEGGPGGFRQFGAGLGERAGAGVGRGQAGRFGHPVQGGPPGGLRGGAVLAGEPFEEGAVGGGGRQVGLGLPVQGEEFADQDGDRPAVEKDVVVGDEEAVPSVGQVCQGAADQGRGGRVEAAVAVLVEQLGPRGLGVDARLGPRQGRTVRDDLDGGTALAAPEGGAEVGVAVQEGLPGGAEPFGVDRVLDFEDQLHEVHVGGVPLVLVHGVEEQALLEGVRGSTSASAGWVIASSLSVRAGGPAGRVGCALGPF